MRNHSYENVFCLQGHFHANQTHLHMKGFARGLVLKQRHKVTRKWPIRFFPEKKQHGIQQIPIDAFFLANLIPFPGIIPCYTIGERSEIEPPTTLSNGLRARKRNRDKLDLLFGP